MRVITLDTNKAVISVKNVGDNYILQENEMETDLGNIGQIQQPDGTFVTPTPVETTLQPTLEDKINYLYYKSMGVIA